jgi:general secretion pathway protein L
MVVARSLVSNLPVRSLRDLGRRAGVPEFLDWWKTELAQVVPVRVRAALSRRRLRPVLVVNGDCATLWQPVTRDGATSMQPTADVPLAGDAATVAANGRATLERAMGATDARVVVALPPKQVLRRTLTLPAAIEENLAEAIAYDLDRHTPFKADELYFDVAVVQRDTARGLIKVELAAARRGVVDQAITVAESWGAVVAGVVPDAPQAIATSRHDLLAEERRSSGSAWRWQLWVPLVLLLALAAFAAVLPVWQKREYAIALNRSVDEARVQAEVSDRVRTELDRLVGDFNFALERKFAFPSTLQVLEEITKLLPDDTWLTQMELKTTTRGKDAQRDLLLRGESANAGRLITLFEESTVFAQAAPRSPTTKIQPGPGEIFDLAAQLRPLPPPAPALIASNAASADAAKTQGTAPAPAASPPATAPAASTPATAPAATTPLPPAPVSSQPPAPAQAGPAAAQPAKPATGGTPPAAATSGTAMATPGGGAASSASASAPAAAGAPQASGAAGAQPAPDARKAPKS